MHCCEGGPAYNGNTFALYLSEKYQLLSRKYRNLTWTDNDCTVYQKVVDAIQGPHYKRTLRFLLRLSQVRSQVYRKFSTYDIV